MYNYTPQAAHHAKFHFDPTTWVVWANSQFAERTKVSSSNELAKCAMTFFN